MVNSNAFTAWRLFQLNWIPIAAMGLVVLIGGALFGFTIAPVGLGITLGIVIVFALIAYLYASAKGDQADPKLIFPLGAISQLLLIATIMGPLTYVASVTNWPLQDRALLAIDRAIGMDPEVIARYVNDHDWLGGLLVRSYTLIKIILVAIPLVLALTSRFVRLQVFVLAFSLTLIMTLLISTFTPAIGTY